MEAGVLVDFDGKPLFWHLPPDRTAGSLPDNRTFWEIIWANRKHIFGFAHSHPGSGVPGPSWEDITTFAAIEQGLGRRLVWWITSEDSLVTILWSGPGKYDYVTFPLSIPKAKDPIWLDKLRLCSSENFVAQYRANASPEELTVFEELAELDREHGNNPTPENVERK